MSGGEHDISGLHERVYLTPDADGRVGTYGPVLAGCRLSSSLRHVMSFAATSRPRQYICAFIGPAAKHNCHNIIQMLQTD